MSIFKKVMSDQGGANCRFTITQVDTGQTMPQPHVALAHGLEASHADESSSGSGTGTGCHSPEPTSGKKHTGAIEPHKKYAA